MWDQKKSMETAKSVIFVTKRTPSLVLSVNGAWEEIGKNLEPTQNTITTETQADQSKSKDVPPDISTEAD